MTQKSTGYKTLVPGATIGILGSGQLGRMMSMAAKQMGYRVHILTSTIESPAGQVSDLEVQALLDDIDAINAFVEPIDVLTVETENIPVATFDAAACMVPAYPSRKALEVCQNRKLEKQFLVDQGIPTCEFRIIKSLEDLQQGYDQLGVSILKTTTGGYDGKGQHVVRHESDLELGWTRLGVDEAILEKFIEFDFEFSIVACRNSTGELTAYTSIQNEHKNGILDVSLCPSGLSEQLNKEATEMTYEIMESLNCVGVFTVEFFHRNGDVLVNEMAPRPHNSGHLTIEGHSTSQFEQHIRAICGLPSGSNQLIRPIAMANILGCEWEGGHPNWEAALSLPNTKLHLYGKRVPKRERKMGHLTVSADTPEQAMSQAVAARKQISVNSKRGDDITIPEFA